MNNLPTAHILLVEDDEVLALLLERTFKKSAINVTCIGDVDGVEQLIAQNTFDAILLDGNLPSGDGFELCRNLRSKFLGPIILLTGRDDDLDELMGLQLGADDYIRKPAEPRVVVARVAAHLRREARLQNSGVTRDDEIAIGNLIVKFARREVYMHGKVVALTDAEFDLLATLVKHAGEVVSRDQLFQGARGVEYDGLDRSIDMRISRLRKLLGDNTDFPTLIKTVRGKGYLIAK
jgi:two-component system OmpR family response regulator/two-component system response regulator RstA